MPSKTVVVIGSGFFGLSAANRLVKLNKGLTIKLVSLSHYTYYLISSIRVPVQNDTKGTIYPIKDVLDDRVDVIIDEVVEMGQTSLVLKNAGNLKFDALVIATGAKWPDPIGYTHVFKDDYKNYFEEQYNRIRKAKSIVLVGGGFNNIELIGEIIYQYKKELEKGEKKITLIHSREWLLPEEDTYGLSLRKRITKFLSNLKDVELILNNKAIVHEDGRTVEYGNGKEKRVIDADLIISNTGVVASVPPHKYKNFINKNGFVTIEDTLQTNAGGNIFAIGDVTDITYKGLVYRGSWLNVLVENLLIVLEGPIETAQNLAKIKRPLGNIATLVSVGPEYGFGQFSLPLFGTVPIPSWYCVRVKSKDLVRYYAKSLFNS